MEEIKIIDECDMVEFDRLFVECIEETISTLSERLWPLTDKQEGDGMNNQCLRSNLKMISERQNVGGVAISS